MFGLLKEKDFRNVMVSNFVSVIGDSLYYLALITYASKFSNTEFSIALVTASEMLPQALTAITGIFADKSVHKASSMYICDLLRFIFYILIGIFMGFDRSYVILIIIVSLNFISDIAGEFKSGLYSSIIVKIVHNDELEEANALNASIHKIVRIAFEFIAVYLLVIFSFRELAWINAITFLLSGMILASVSKSLRDKTETASKRKSQISYGNHAVSNLWKDLKQNFVKLYRNGELFKLVLLFSYINAFMFAVIPLLQISLTKFSKLVIGNFTFTVAIIGAVTSIGMILGSMLGHRIFKDVSLNKLAKITLLVIGLIYINILLLNIWVVLFLLAILYFLDGAMGPKFYAHVMLMVGENEIASNLGIINTILVVFSPIATIILTIISNFCGIKTTLIIALFTMFFTTIIVIYIIKRDNLRKNKSTSI